MDGAAQRRALTAAERALRLLGSRDTAGARRAAATATELDQVGLFAGLADAVSRAATEIESSGSVSAATAHDVVAVVDPGPLAVLAREAVGG